jgi:hypothetical protein
VSTANSPTKLDGAGPQAVRLADFRPVACDSLARVGGPHDGGYVVPLNAIAATDALLSFGLSHDWTFERDFRRRNPRAVIHCYDHTVTVRSAFLYSIGQLLRFAVRWNGRYLRKSFAWIDYLLFFRGNNVHFRQRVWRDRSENSATVDDALARFASASQVFVKVDIEGTEYRILDSLIERSRNIVALAIEFHDVDILAERFTSLVDKIKREFHIVHIHGNNLAGVTPSGFPMSPEITFLNKRFFTSPPQPTRLNYPVAGLDSANYPRLPDIELKF